ncbi:MAG: RNA methyltransferase [Armatimonadota bacterium]
MMDIERIDSQKHQVIQMLRDLQTERSRAETGAFHVEGAMLVSRALEYGPGVRCIVFTDKFLSSAECQSIQIASEQSGVNIYSVTEGLMTKIVPAKPAPGVVAVVERRLYKPSELLDGENPLLMLIDRCENPDNLGMLLRSLDAAGVDGVAITSDSVDPFSRLCVRASRGSVLSLRLAIVSEPENWLAQAQEEGFKVVASSAHATKNIWATDFTGSRVLIVGNEHTGVRQSIRDIADWFIQIPMAGKMESLNIAVSSAIMAYEAARQRDNN